MADGDSAGSGGPGPPPADPLLSASSPAPSPAPSLTPASDKSPSPKSTSRAATPAPASQPSSRPPTPADQEKKKEKESKKGFSLLPGSKNKEEKKVEEKKKAKFGLSLKSKGGNEKDKNKDEEEESEEDETGEPTEGGKKGKKVKKKKKPPEAGYTADVQEAHERINPEVLSKKEELFQIRFIVHKARKLSGAIQAPLVRIHLDTKVLRTKARRGKSPKWNETVLFSITKSEFDLVNTPVEIKVIDSAKKTQLSLVGLYKCDLSVAWVKKGKNLFYKWIALTNPDEPQDGLTGYVNVSIQIIPPGESAKDLPKLRDEEIDRSDNVFFPPGIVLQPGQFTVKLFSGEDIPQMDSAVLEGMKKIITGADENAPAKELVDPYVKVEFAGKEEESNYIEGCFDPIWNDMLILQGDFPSIAENLILKLYDNDDFAVDDLIATKLLKMDEISQSSVDSGAGFLPMFGPAYIPFYGSHREYSDVYDKYSDLNHGVEEGIAYRGRILVDISTNMGPAPEDQEPVTDLEQDEVDRVMVNLGRQKYHLFASFFQGNMISEKENQVEFEVSIGDYGNKFSPRSDPAPSTTQPCNPVYDGTEYHFMPWSRTKPTVILHSEWEDVEYRVGALNTLIWMRDFMSEKLEQYATLEKAYAKEVDLITKFEKSLEELLNVLRGTEIEEPGEQATELDHKLYDKRMFSINNMIEEITAMMENGKYYYMSLPDKKKKLEGVYEKLEDLCVEPQLGIPDVFIWMLTGSKRVAYVRIPVNDLMYSKSKFKRGKHCGTTSSFFLKIPREDTIGAHLTLSLWFGRFEDVTETFKPPRGSEVIVYAETYENQMSMLGNWTTKLLPRPVFSDSTGKHSLPLDAFKAPEGWTFVEDWFISIDRSLTYDNESGLREVTDVVYEGETRIPGTAWGGNFCTTWWQDIKGNADAPSKDQMECPEGWQWLSEWEVDTNRAVDALGWEFAMDTNVGNYSPIERNYHLSRRKKWIRTRERISDATLIKKRDIDPDGWEYSKIFTTKFHPKERKFDMVRRRRYNRKLVSSIPRPVSFKIVEEAKGDKPAKEFYTSPRIITEYDEKQVHKYQLRAYLYQARGVLGADPSGYSDPYARVVFGNRSAVTHTLKETCSPVWNTTLVLDAVELCGYPEDIASNPPFIVVDIFDEDVLTHDKLGRVVCKPATFTSGKYTCTKLKWYEIGGVKKSKGDLLAAFELFKLGDGGIELPFMPPFEDQKYLVPPEISPQKKLMRVEVLTWGVRQMKDYKMLPVESPHIDIEIGGQRISVDKIVSCKNHPNFTSPYEFFDVWLPEAEEYLPPINIRVMDNRAFGYTPLIAVATIKEYARYRTTFNATAAEALSKEANFLKELMGEQILELDKEPAPSEADKGAILDLNDGGSISLNIEVDLGSEVAIPIDVPPSEQGADGALIFSNLSIATADRTPAPSMVPSIVPSGQTPSVHTTPSVFIQNPSQTRTASSHTPSVAPSDQLAPSVQSGTPSPADPSVQTDSAPHPDQSIPPSVQLIAPSLKTIASIPTAFSSKEDLSAKVDPSIHVDPSVKLDPSVKADSSVKADPSLKADPSVQKAPSVQSYPLIENTPSVTTKDPDMVSNNMSKDPSYTDITIEIPQGVIDASQTGEPVDPKIQKRLEKDLKRQEKAAKKDAKLRKKLQKIEKKDRENAMKKEEKERQRKAKEQSKAKYKAEKEAKKKALKDAEDDSDSEEFVPETPDKKHVADPLAPNNTLPQGGSGMLGKLYGSESGGSKAPAETKSSISKLSRKETRKLKMEDEAKPHPDDVLVSDWWSKYYHALGKDERLTRVFKQRNLPTLTMYEYELEKEFDDFRDLMEVIKLQRPDNELPSDFEIDSDDDDAHVGLFKGSFRIYEITEEEHKKAEKEHPALLFRNLPSNDVEKVIVRLYVIAGINLTPLDLGGSVDPYLYVKCGKEIKSDKSNYLTRQINPEFGKMFEFVAQLPRDSLLNITVYDHDMIGSDDIVGSTIIDLEDRFLTWKHASCGVAKQYIVDKENKDFWRDSVKPIGLLKKICVLRGWPQPTFKGKGSTLRCYVNGNEYKIKYFESSRAKKGPEDKMFGSDEHRLALYVLHELGVVPEHFETRTLFNEDCPGIPQGKLHLWVDIFPWDRNPPPPINIAPRESQKMVLRVIVWNTMDVILSDENFMGERMSDIYLKIHLEGMKKDRQETDIHFRSLTGEGNFNWRMVYEFDYLLAEQKLVTYQRKSIFQLEKEMIKEDFNIHIEVYDYDIFSSDDLLGWTEFSLVAMPPPTKTAKECTLDVYDKVTDDEKISIIDKKKIRGFWPVYDDSLTGEKELTGKVELEIEILTAEEAEEKKAGLGRSEPNENPTLEPPDRPNTSFSWFMNPLIVFKILVWDKYKWYIIGAFLILLLIAFIGLLIYTSPGAMTAALFG